MAPAARPAGGVHRAGGSEPRPSAPAGEPRPPPAGLVTLLPTLSSARCCTLLPGPAGASGLGLAAGLRRRWTCWCLSSSLWWAAAEAWMEPGPAGSRAQFPVATGDSCWRSVRQAHARLAPPRLLLAACTRLPPTAAPAAPPDAGDVHPQALHAPHCLPGSAVAAVPSAQRGLGGGLLGWVAWGRHGCLPERPPPLRAARANMSRPVGVYADDG